MSAKSARDFQAFRVLLNEMTMRHGLRRVATLCNRVTLTAIRHPTYVPIYVTCKLFRICMLFANLPPQPQTHLRIPIRFLVFRWNRYLKSWTKRNCYKEWRENSDDKKKLQDCMFSRRNFKIANNKISVNMTSKNFWLKKLLDLRKIELLCKLEVKKSIINIICSITAKLRAVSNNDFFCYLFRK